MAVFIPEGALVGEGAVRDGDVVVVVVGGEGSTLVVGHGVAWKQQGAVIHSYGFLKENKINITLFKELGGKATS